MGHWVKRRLIDAFLLSGFVLTAQAPESVPIGAPSVATEGQLQTLRTSINEANELLKATKSREALSKLEAALANPLPKWDTTNPQTQSNSRAIYALYGYCFHLAGKVADMGGYWEKSLEYFQKSKAAFETNAENIKATFPAIASHYKNITEKSRRSMDENAGYIKELRTKKDPDAGDRQQLELVDREESSISFNLKQSETYHGYLESSQKEAEYYGKFVQIEEAWLKGQAEELEKYHFKNDKRKFVEGIMGAKGFLEKHFPDHLDRLRYLYRLNVLDPANAKVIQEIEMLSGVSIPRAVTQENEKVTVKPETNYNKKRKKG